MNNYETILILNPEMGADDIDSLVNNIKTLINNNGEVISTESWGLRVLAYPIQKHNKGYYVLMEFKSTPEFIDELNRNYNIEESIMKHIIVKKD